MKGYWQYVEDVKTGKIPTGNLIRLSVDRFEKFCKREDMYLDEDVVDKYILFISKMEHFLGKSAGKPFILSPWQEFFIANVIGVKWKKNNHRVCKETYVQIARKAGKDAFIAAIALAQLVIDGEASPEIACLANSREQARILFDYIANFAKSLDPEEEILLRYRNYVKCIKNNGTIKIYSADASKLDGLNVSLGCIDEYHEAKDRKLYDVIKSSCSMRESPLNVIITTAGFNLESPCHDMYELSIQILNGVKEDNTFMPFIWEMDEDDDWTNPANFIKCQPNLGVTVTEEFMSGEVVKAKNDATAMNGILTKTFNKWCQSIMTWIPQEKVVKCMREVKLEDYRGKIAVIGQDLGSVSDFSSISVYIPEGNVFKTFTFIPNETYKTHPNRELYKKFVGEGTMIVTQGNCTDYDYIINKIGEISRIVEVKAIYTDSWNATAEMIKLTELGYNVVPFSQAIGNYNNCTKEMERLIREQQCIIDKSANILWQFGNVVIKQDINGNAKPSKEMSTGNVKKIDSIISMTTALGGFQKENISLDTEIMFF